MRNKSAATRNHLVDDMEHRRSRTAGSDERGTATVEYVVILVSVALVGALATVAVGPPLVRAFSAQVTWLLLPFP